MIRNTEMLKLWETSAIVLLCSAPDRDNASGSLMGVANWVEPYVSAPSAVACVRPKTTSAGYAIAAHEQLSGE